MKSLLNLYTDELREKPVPYGFPWLVGSVVTMVLLLLAQGSYTQHRLGNMEAENQVLQARQQALKSSVDALEAQLATQDQREGIDRETASLLEDIHSREQLLAELNTLLERPVEGFSRPLHGLASASGQGVWLTKIHLRASGSGQPLAEVRLIGRMLRGDQLPRYIDAMNRAEALRGLHFNSMQASRTLQESGGKAGTPPTLARPAQGESLTFLLSTRPDDALEGVER